MTTSGRVLLADDSPHAQRMGERILREEGFEVVTVTDGETAIIRLKDVDPDVVIVDAFLPQVSGYDLCGYIKKQPQHSHVRVILTSTALERVDEDQAYKAGADGQLKKPFEASVMLKSLKDLIGGSDKKKRTDTTSLGLSYNDEPILAKPDAPSANADEEEASSEKPVSALQAWLQQHDSGSYADTAAEVAPEAEEKDEPAPASVSAVEEVEEASGRLSNPQLLRRVEEEPEDLSLRNNPVARLRYAPQPSADARQAEPANASVRSEARGPRIQPVSAPAEEAASSAPVEPARPPRKSLLEQLEEFEKAAADGGTELSATATFAKSAAAPETPVMDTSVAAETSQPEPKPAEEASVAAAAPSVETAADEADDTGEDEEEFLLMRTRKGRQGRPSLLETLGETMDEESALEASHVEPREEVEPVAEVAAPIGAESVTAALDTARQAAAISLSEAGVRLDEEEVRAVVEIAVSAAMPAIVEEVARCVLLALDSRYAEKMPANGNH
ncbi:MAG: response regulator [Bryobacterales bacterium]|nr:response regulator [Bryobacterales bacterium]